MKVVIYRPDTATQDVCAVAVLDTPQWALAELLLSVGMDGGIESEPFAVDPVDPWAAIALGDPGTADTAADRLYCSDPDYTGHALGAILLVLPAWGAGGPLPELFGDGWWRFLTASAQEKLLGAADDETDPPPMVLRLERRATGGYSCAPGEPVRFTQGSDEGAMILRQGEEGDRVAGLHFMSGAPLDVTACGILQSLGEVLRIRGIALSRTQSDDLPGGERVSLSLLAMDSDLE